MSRRGIRGIKGLCIIWVLIPAVAGAATINWNYDSAGYDADPAQMQAIFGTKVDELDAAGTGFNFGGPLDPYRNLNIITTVYQATQTVNIGLGESGMQITLQPNDYTFAYTLDYTGTVNTVTNKNIWSFQLYRVIIDEWFNGISNPGPFMALDEVIAGAYNTTSVVPYDTPPFIPYDPNPVNASGVTGEEIDSFIGGFGAFQSSEAEFTWDVNDSVLGTTKAMVLLFTTPDVQIMRIGWDNGDTGEGANVFGGGGALDGIPVLVPVVPEPVTFGMLVLGGSFLLNRRRRPLSY